MRNKQRVAGVPLKPQHAKKHILKLFSGKSNGLARREMLDREHLLLEQTLSTHKYMHSMCFTEQPARSKNS